MEKGIKQGGKNECLYFLLEDGGSDSVMLELKGFLSDHHEQKVQANPVVLFEAAG